MQRKSVDAVEKLYAIFASVSVVMYFLSLVSEEHSSQSAENIMMVMMVCNGIFGLASLLRAIIVGRDRSIAMKRLKTLKYGMLVPLLGFVAMIAFTFVVYFLGGTLILFFLGPAAPLISGMAYLVVLAMILLWMELQILPGAILGIQVLCRAHRDRALGLRTCVFHGLLLFIPFLDIVDTAILSRFLRE